MSASNRTPQDISGLQDALQARQINVSDEIAEALAMLKELRQVKKEELTEAHKFNMAACMKTLQGCAMLIKARPELTGRSAGRVSGAELLAADSHGYSATQGNYQDKGVLRVPIPDDY